MHFWLKFALAFRFFMTKFIAISTFNFILKRRKVVICILLYSIINSFLFVFSSNDGFVCNTLNGFMTKIMTWETLSIEEEIYAIIEPSICVYLLVGISLKVIPVSVLCIEVVMIYLWSIFILFLKDGALLTGFCCI